MIDQLQRWFINFNKAQFLILTLEDLEKNPKNIILKILQFLNITYYSSKDFNYRSEEELLRVLNTRSLITKNKNIKNISLKNMNLYNKINNFYKPYNMKLQYMLDSDLGYTV